MISDFLNAAFPFIVIGLAIAFVAANFAPKKKVRILPDIFYMTLK